MNKASSPSYLLPQVPAPQAPSLVGAGRGLGRGTRLGLGLGLGGEVFSGVPASASEVAFPPHDPDSAVSAVPASALLACGSPLGDDSAPALPVAELDIRFSDEVGWVTLQMDGWNHFPISDDLGSGPFDFRVRAIDGQELVEEGVEYAPGGVVEGTGQFEI
jgi:hypothetical protein